MDELHAAIAAYLREQLGELPRRRTSPSPAEEREVAIYARAMTASDAADLEAQIAACLAFAQSRGDSNVLTFPEVASGDSLERPRLAELRSAVAHGWIATVLVTTADRLALDPVLFAALRAEWAAYGTTIIAVMGGR